MTIPRIVHQIWLQGFAHAPAHVQEAVEKSKSVWGATAVTLWDETAIRGFLQDHYPQDVETFNRIQVLVSKSDFARLRILHHYGGVYADCDYIPSSVFSAVAWSTLDEWIADGRAFGAVATEGKYKYLFSVNNYLMWALPKRIPLDVRPWQSGPWDFVFDLVIPTWEVLATYGPVALSRRWHNEKDVYNISETLAHSVWGEHKAEGLWNHDKKTNFQIQLMLFLLFFAAIGVAGTLYVVASLHV